jgi:hypothetical protein
MEKEDCTLDGIFGAETKQHVLRSCAPSDIPKLFLSNWSWIWMLSLSQNVRSVEVVDI